MSFSVSWDETNPPGGQDRSLGDDRIREFKTQMRERMGVDHHFLAADDANTGYHEKATFINQASDPAQVASALILYAKTVGGARELYSRHESAALQQLTLQGQLWISALGITGAASGDLIYRGASVFDRLPKGANGDLLTLVLGLPAWFTPSYLTAMPSGSFINFSNYSRTDTVSCATAIAYNNSSRASTVGNQILTVNHTPASNSNKLIIEVVANYGASSGCNAAIILMNGTTVLATARTTQPANGGQITLKFILTSPGTSAITFNVNLGADTDTAILNGSNAGAGLDNTKLTSSITITEVKG